MSKKAIETENTNLNAFQNEPSTEGGDLLSDFANAGAMSESDDETLDMDTSDVYDEVVHPTGTECQVRIISVDSSYSEKAEAKFWRISLEDANDPHVKRFSYFLWFEGKKDDVRRRNNKKKEFMNFRAAFGLAEGQPVSKNDLPGSIAWCILRKKETVEYGEQNEVSKWIAGRQGF